MKQTKINEIKSDVLTRLIVGMENYAGRQEDAIKGRYAFIPFPIDSFIKQLDFVIKKIFKIDVETLSHPLTFLDAGCGIGATVKVAYTMGFSSKGIEINPELIEFARRLNFRENIIRGDILNFRGYKEYDIIYYYCPIDRTNLEKRFEKKVEEHLKVGGVVIANQKQDHNFEDNKNFKSYYFTKYHHHEDSDMIFQKIGPTSLAGKIKHKISELIKR